MRLINADMLMKEYQVKLCCNTDCINCTLFQGDGEECLFERFVKNAPTIDAVPVVRCQDCKWYDKKYPNGTVCCNDFFCKFYRTFNPPYHFCALGERRTNAN